MFDVAARMLRFLFCNVPFGIWPRSIHCRSCSSRGVDAAGGSAHIALAYFFGAIMQEFILVVRKLAFSNSLPLLHPPVN